ncbi:MAG: hypothetical protein AAGL17_17025, partial [Cyanobacteria bacterium J06576_12]
MVSNLKPTLFSVGLWAMFSLSVMEAGSVRSVNAQSVPTGNTTAELLPQLSDTQRLDSDGTILRPAVPSIPNVVSRQSTIPTSPPQLPAGCFTLPHETVFLVSTRIETSFDSR